MSPERRRIVDRVKSEEWGADLFEAVQHECLRVSERCIFNDLFQELSQDQYAQFDFKYSTFFRPQDKGLILWLRAEHSTNGGDIEAWTKRKRELLLKKKELLEKLQKSSKS